MSEPLIYIPTFRRPDRQTTWDNLTDEWRERTVMVCDAQDAIDLLDYPILVCPVEEGIAGVRQWIMDQHDVSESENLLMLDDDLAFYERRFDDPRKFRQLTDRSESGPVLDRLIEMLDQVPFAGVIDRSGGNRYDAPVASAGRTHDVHAVHVPTLRAEGIRYDRLTLMEDFDVNLQLLTRGYTTARLSTHCKGSTSRNADGGCSVYRDSTAQTAAATALAALHPGLVRLSERPGWGTEESRTDVVVSWQKAAAQGWAAREVAGREQEKTPDWAGLAPEWDLF
jgi:hypothetical protein